MIKPTVLMVLDGWGIARDSEVNAITEAPDRVLRGLSERYLATEVQAHGNAVGLMADQMGDSNVGHLTIGAGRIIRQNLPRIFQAIQQGTLEENPVLKEFIRQAQDGERRVHVMGLLSPGGVHSHQDHLRALFGVFRRYGLHDVFLHIWLDGRDVPPESAMSSLEFLAEAMNTEGIGRVASVSGRYYAMDRDQRWERTEKAFRAMVEGQGPTARSAPEALMAAYQKGQTDEFVEPTVIVSEAGKPVATISSEDLVFVFNFRADRVRQITRALADQAFSRFDRPFDRVSGVTGMTQYDEEFILPALFPPEIVTNNLAEWLSKQGISQFHIAETEKYAHVTFFFNGGVEKVYPGEDRLLIPSPKVATYDLKPEMSAEAIADKVVEDIQAGAHDFILLNFANSDMVGHTGKLEAAKVAVRTVDRQIGRIAEAVLTQKGVLAIVADHGNAEVMQDETGQPHTNHTTNPVPFVVIGPSALLANKRLASGGGLQDVAPTVLDVMGLPVPQEMTGSSLLTKVPQDDEV